MPPLLFTPDADSMLAECAGDPSRANLCVARWDAVPLLRELRWRANIQDYSTVPAAMEAQFPAPYEAQSTAQDEAQSTAQDEAQSTVLRSAPREEFVLDISAPASPLADTMAPSESPPCALQLILGDEFESMLQEDDGMLDEDTSRLASSPINDTAWPSYNLQYQTAMAVLSNGLADAGDDMENNAPPSPRASHAAHPLTPSTREKPLRPVHRTFGYAASLGRSFADVI